MSLVVVPTQCPLKEPWGPQEELPKNNRGWLSPELPSPELLA